MKAKSIFAASLLIAGAAFATEVDTEYVLGVLPLQNVGKEAVLNIPWIEAGTDKDCIAVQNIVKTAGLEDGDVLLWYNGSQYYSWYIQTVAGVKQWTASASVGLEDVSSIASDSIELSRGQALILNRKASYEAKPSTTVYIVGQYSATGSTSSTIAKGTIGTPVFSLIAPPNVDVTTPVDLAAKFAASGEGTVAPCVGDAITFVNSSGNVVTYTWGKITATSANGWGQGTFSNTGVYTFVAAEAKAMELDAGKGFWYKRCGGAENVTVSW